MSLKSCCEVSGACMGLGHFSVQLTRLTSHGFAIQVGFRLARLSSSCASVGDPHGIIGSDGEAQSIPHPHSKIVDMARHEIKNEGGHGLGLRDGRWYWSEIIYFQGLATLLKFCECLCQAEKLVKTSKYGKGAMARTVTLQQLHFVSKARAHSSHMKPMFQPQHNMNVP